MKYDDASWHSGGNFPADLTDDASFTHTGLFLAWMLLVGLGSTELIDDMGEDYQRLQKRATSPSHIFKVIDGKFTDANLSDEGNEFTRDYFDFETGQYLRDYEDILGRSVPTLYHVADTWENFDKLRPVLESRLAAWRAARRK